MTEIIDVNIKTYKKIRNDTVCIRVRSSSAVESAKINWGKHLPAINAELSRKIKLPPLEVGEEYNKAMASHVKQLRTTLKAVSVGSSINGANADKQSALNSIIKTLPEYRNYTLLTNEAYDFYKEYAAQKKQEWHNALTEFVERYDEIILDHKRLILQGYKEQILTQWADEHDEVIKKVFLKYNDVKKFLAEQIEEHNDEFIFESEHSLIQEFRVDIPKNPNQKIKVNRIKLKRSNILTPAENAAEKAIEYDSKWYVYVITNRADLKTKYYKMVAAEDTALTYEHVSYIKRGHSLEVVLKDLPTIENIKARLKLETEEIDRIQKTTAQRRKDMGNVEEKIITCDEVLSNTIGRVTEVMMIDLSHALYEILKTYYGKSFLDNDALIWTAKEFDAKAKIHFDYQYKYKNDKDVDKPTHDTSRQMGHTTLNTLTGIETTTGTSQGLIEQIKSMKTPIPLQHVKELDVPINDFLAILDANGAHKAKDFTAPIKEFVTIYKKIRYFNKKVLSKGKKFLE